MPDSIAGQSIYIIPRMDWPASLDAKVVKRGTEAANPDPVEKDDFVVEVFVCEDLKKLCEKACHSHRRFLSKSTAGTSQ